MKTTSSRSSRGWLRLVAALGWAVATTVACGPAVAQPIYNIIDIGRAPGDNYTEALYISPGGVATGRSMGALSGTAFSWTQAGGYVRLPNLTTPSLPWGRGNGANDSGVVVGSGQQSFGAPYNPVPVIWQGGVATQLPLPTGQTFGEAYAINNSGVAVGSVGTNAGFFVNTSRLGVIYSGGTASIITQLTADGAHCTSASDINNAGRIIGSGFNPSTGASVGYVLDTRTNTAFSVGTLPGTNNAHNYDVSNAGHVVGACQLNQNPALPFIWTDAGGMVGIPLVPGTTAGNAAAVNSAGWVVGTDAGAIPFLYDGVSTYRLGDLIPAGSGWDLLYAAGISDDGVIVGVGGFNDEVHGFAMIPVPEPSTFGLASVAAVAAAIWRRRCR